MECYGSMALALRVSTRHPQGDSQKTVKLLIHVRGV